MEELVASIVDDAVRELREGLQWYWPSEGDNEMPEAHAVGAVGRAFGRNGFHVYHEVQCRTAGAVGHVDLVALANDQATCIAVEGKRLYDGRKAEALLQDWKRLGILRLASEHGFPAAQRHYRMLVMTTWQPNIRDWWLGSDEVPTRRRHSSWPELRRELSGAVVRGLQIQTDPDWGEQWLLFALGKRDRSFFATRSS